MEFTDVINKRTSIRCFSPNEVTNDQLTYIFECARRAPSWANKQCWRFVVVKNNETIKEIAQTSVINLWLRNAPVLIIACADPLQSGSFNRIKYYAVDVAIALEHLILAATNIGLGTCWIAWFDEGKIKQILHIPKRIRVIAITPVGYPADHMNFSAKIRSSITRRATRKNLDEIVKYEHW
jgi:nitroreductase